MQGGKKDHFVPQGYLRQFAIDKDKHNIPRADWKVHTLRRKSPKLPAPAARIDSVAYGKYFERYGLDEAVNEEIRSKINKVENRFFEVQEKLVQTEDLTKLEAEDFTGLVLYTAFQRERTLARRQFYKRQLESAAKSFDEEAQEFTGFHAMTAQEEADRTITSIEAEFEETVLHGSIEEIVTLFRKWNIDVSSLGIDLASLNIPGIRRVVADTCSDVVEKAAQNALEGTLMPDVAQEMSAMAKSRDKLRNYHLEKMFEFAVSLAEDLQGCTWTLNKNLTSRPFWTSDNPVVTHTRPSKEEDARVDELLKSLKMMAAIVEPANLRDRNGQINDTFELLFPISPALLLRVGGLEGERGLRVAKVAVGDERGVASFNYFQFVSTSTNLYSNAPEFDGLSEMGHQTKHILNAAMKDLRALPERVEALIEEMRKRE